jgi:hypothetical protein
MIAADATRRLVYRATVHSTDGVRFSARADGPEALTREILSYVRERCDSVLWAEDAEAVRKLMDQNRHDAAIALYFDRVGERWDEEWLEAADGP